LAIKQPRRFVTTDQGHADVLNAPIDTLYENDQALAAQLESIKTHPAGNDIASKAALDKHAADTNLHVTAAKQATWNAAEGNAKKYTEQYAAPKAHTHLASDLPSASTQARGITQLNTSVNSTATDQAATPSAVKSANDRANEAYNLAQQSLTQAVDLKNKVVGAINGKNGSASPDMNADQIAAAISAIPAAKVASGTLSNSSTTANGEVRHNLSVRGLGFKPTNFFVSVNLGGGGGNKSWSTLVSGTIEKDQVLYSSQNDASTAGYAKINTESVTFYNDGFSCDLVGRVNLLPGVDSFRGTVTAYKWLAIG
jgi:hypothetical protein